MNIRLPDPIVAVDDVPGIQLTPMEERLLSFLVANQGVVMTHTEIAIKLWREPDQELAAAMTRPLCAKLRKKIGAERIATARGRGYVYL